MCLFIIYASQYVASLAINHVVFPPKKGRKDDVIVKKYCSKQSAVMHDSLINSSQRETSDDIGEKLLSSKQIFIFHNN